MRPIEVGQTHQLQQSWSSANDEVATVDATGLVTAVGMGTAEIYCTVDGLSVATIVTVVEPPPPLPETPDV